MKLNRGVMLIVTLVLGSASAYFMTHLLGNVPSPNQIAPAVLIAAVSAPVLYVWQCITKITELQKLSGISKSEFRRLEPKIKASKAFYWGKLIFMVVCNITLGFFFFFAPTGLQILEIPVMNISVAVLGFMAVFCLVTLLECYTETHTIQQFEARITKRENEKKLVTDALSRLKPQQSK